MLNGCECALEAKDQYLFKHLVHEYTVRLGLHCTKLNVVVEEGALEVAVYNMVLWDSIRTSTPLYGTI
jgi:hypothetical protein